MDVAAVTSLAQALTHNTTLRSLSLSGNEIGDRGAQAIAAMLATNRTLTRLDLSVRAMSRISLSLAHWIIGPLYHCIIGIVALAR